MLRRESGGLDTASLGEAVLSLLLGMPELRPSELTWVVKLAGEVREFFGGGWSGITFGHHGVAASQAA